MSSSPADIRNFRIVISGYFPIFLTWMEVACVAPMQGNARTGFEPTDWFSQWSIAEMSPITGFELDLGFGHEDPVGFGTDAGSNCSTQTGFGICPVDTDFDIFEFDSHDVTDDFDDDLDKFDSSNRIRFRGDA